MTDLDKAREEWERNRAALAPRNHVTHHTDCGCFTIAADALIAALEAEVERLESELRDLTVEYLSSGPWCEECGRVTNEANNPEHPGKCNACQRAEAAEAEVERLKGQDCASCSHTKQDTALYPPPPPNYEVYSYCGCPDSPCYMRVITPVDRCAHWSARLTAPEPKEEE